MMEQPDPTHDVTYDPTYERGHGPDRAGDDPRDDTVREKDAGEIGTIRPTEVGDPEPGSTYGTAGDQDMGWRGARDREYFG